VATRPSIIPIAAVVTIVTIAAMTHFSAVSRYDLAWFSSTAPCIRIVRKIKDQVAN